MSQNEATISIDLTEDDIELQGKEPRFPFANHNNLIPHVNTEKQDHKDTESQNEGAASIMENLKDNPHIETVFIESDEDDNMEGNIKQIKVPHINIHNVVVLKPTEKNIENVNTESLLKAACTTIATTNNETTIPSIKTSTQPSLPVMATNAVLPFSVNSITPLSFKTTFSDNSRTFALQDETNKLSPKKYLVIPKELVSFLANKQSPISLNVPGIGPLLIQNPSNIFSSQEPIYLNNSSSKLNHKNTISKKMPKEVVYEPLGDTKYCWRFPRRKRDLDGFSMGDRLGFYNAEQQRTRVCATKLKEIIKRKQLAIDAKEKALMAIRKSNLNMKPSMKHIKLVEIDHIKKGKRRGLKQTKHKDTVKLKMSPLLANSKQKFSPRTQLSSESDNNQMYNDPDNDLLVTKKVVFINESEHPRGKKRRSGWFNDGYRKNERKKMQKLKYQEYLPSQIVHETDTKAQKAKVKKNNKPDSSQSKRNQKVMLRKKDKVTTGMCLNKSPWERKRDISNKSSLKKNTKHELRYSKTQAVKGQTNKLNFVPKSEKKLSNDKIHEIKPCYIEFTHDKLMQEALDKYNAYTVKYIKNLGNRCKLITDLKQFQQEIQPIKPILVIGETHCSKMDFQDLFCKYNLVFPLSENVENAYFSNLQITNRLFVESAMKGYIKFVQPRILCRYLAGFREP